MNRKIRYGNSTILYSVIRSKRRKTSQITVDENQVIVRAPKSKSLKEIQNIMQDKAQWVFRKQLEFQKIKPSIRKISYSAGDIKKPDKLSAQFHEYALKVTA